MSLLVVPIRKSTGKRVSELRTKQGVLFVAQAGRSLSEATFLVVRMLRLDHDTVGKALEGCALVVWLYRLDRTVKKDGTQRASNQHAAIHEINGVTGTESTGIGLGTEHLVHMGAGSECCR